LVDCHPGLCSGITTFLSLRSSTKCWSRSCQNKFCRDFDALRHAKRLSYRSASGPATFALEHTRPTHLSYFLILPTFSLLSSLVSRLKSSYLLYLWSPGSALQAGGTFRQETSGARMRSILLDWSWGFLSSFALPFRSFNGK